MAGGKPNCHKILLNLISALNFAWKNRSYDVFSLWIPDYHLDTYPDVMVVYTPLIFAKNRQDTIVNPLMIAEILSDSTAK